MQEYIALIIGHRLFGVPIRAAMRVGTALTVGPQVRSIQAAFMSVNLDVNAFLFGMFSVVSPLERARFFERAGLK
jgi:Na+/H+ antiporter NhaD/arsenite permease-like protein